MNNINKLFQQAVEHRNFHDCSAYPYEQGDKLVEAIKKYQPSKILEIGTGMGYSACIMALAAPEAHITSIEKDLEHIGAAKQFLQDNGVLGRVSLVSEPAELFLPKLKEQFDFIFFDGFQIHYQFLIEYEKLLKPNGILFLGNNHLKSRTSDMFFDELQDTSNWHIIDQFAETTVAKRV